VPLKRQRLGQIDLFTKRVRASVYRRSASEFQLACSIADLLRGAIAPGWAWSHFPAGEERPTAAGARLQRMGLKRGWPDLILFAPQGGGPRFLELKRWRGGLSDDQNIFAAWALQQGYDYTSADTFEDALAVLRHWGAMRGLQ
jgi:hypothetical protein